MSEAENNGPTFSFVVPVYNEQEGLEGFYQRLTTAAEALAEPYEIIFVDDGSSDETPAMIRRLIDDDPRVKLVELSRNFGHQLAITAGYDYAAGRAVISLDGDCQHPPELIGDLVARWREGFEVVCTVRKDTDGISPIRRGLGRLVYRVMAAATGADLTDQADFRLLDRKAVDAIKKHREQARFLRGLVRWIGFRQTSLPYVAEKRAAGRSSYTLKQLVGMSGAGIFNFSLRPLRLASLLGGLFLTAAAGYLAVSLVLLGFGISAGWPVHLVVLGVAMFGLQFVLLGVIGEYVGRIFDEAKDRPLYIVRETIGLTEAKDQDAAEPKSQDQQQGQRFTVYT